MKNAFTPLVFYHHHQRLRAVMVDNQPWFVAHDFAQLIGLADALPLLPALEPHQQQTLSLSYTDDFHEEVVVISDIGAYRALFQFGKPKHSDVGRWVNEVLVPTMHDYHRTPDAAPTRETLIYEGRQLGVVRWQGELWVAWRDLPLFMANGQEVSA
ncbi:MULTISPECIES: Bro-N domain-containing protein [Pseudomonas]|uniref:BRO-N domain-containing protein n=1 Tax=Pseudomonas TaxID=286 RepID=UPI000DA7CF2E|nr:MULTISPECIES: BRO family protein [Pseudomonas]MDW3711706.1 BRO family protein [Pseudomonas sp. 2023EL-01195]PZE09445.1 phage antirepressor [Pseudomonas sp. 57B-090624]